MATITFDQIDTYMRDSENISNSKWIRDEMKKQEYYTESKIEQNESNTGPKYFPDYEKLFTVIHKKCNRNWTEPIPVSGYMGEIVYIKPPKKKKTGPITFGHEIPSRPISKKTKEEEEEELLRFMEEFCCSESDSELEDEEEDEEEEEEEEDISNKQETEAELREKYRKITSNLFAEN
jgi:hypothetical protein